MIKIWKIWKIPNLFFDIQYVFWFIQKCSDQLSEVDNTDSLKVVNNVKEKTIEEEEEVEEEVGVDQISVCARCWENSQLFLINFFYPSLR